MKKFRLTKNWRLAAILIPAVVVMYLLINFLVIPRFEAWILSQIPGSTAVKKALEAQFPQDSVSISSNTTYGSGTSSDQRTLTIGEVGNNFLTPNQLSKAANTICTSLGQNAKKYNSIYIQNTSAHWTIFFYASHSLSQPVTCNNEQ